MNKLIIIYMKTIDFLVALCRQLWVLYWIEHTPISCKLVFTRTKSNKK